MTAETRRGRDHMKQVRESTKDTASDPTRSWLSSLAGSRTIVRLLYIWSDLCRPVLVLLCFSSFVSRSVRFTTIYWIKKCWQLAPGVLLLSFVI